ncbi:MAG: DUF3320 domain-containing protein [Acutalibacteraceae bacterium]
MTSNFEFLSKYWSDLSEIGKAAEAYLYTDANACIYKLGLLSECIVTKICGFEGVDITPEMSHADRIRTLKYRGVLPKNIDDILFLLRKARNDAVHTGEASFEKSKALLRMAFNLCNWFMEVYGDWSFTAAKFVMPEDNSLREDYEERLRVQEEKIKELTQAIESVKTAASDVSKEERAQRATDVSAKLELTEEEEKYIVSEPVRMDIAVIPVINYALQQNKVPVIQGISIINKSDNAIENAELNIVSPQNLCEPYSLKIDYIPANKTYKIKDVKLQINSDLTASITEKISGSLAIALSDESGILTRDNVDITVLPFDQWHGYGIYPELLTAFVTPNHPIISRIITRAAELMQQWTGDPSMDAYFSQDANRVLKQAAAIFGAIKEENIVYCVNPASFEQVGQRVRLCDTVLQQKIGNCLDLTLLYASCLEAVGLHPIMIIAHKHIFSGVWLDALSFPESIQDDPSVITKRLASGVNEIAVAETTLAVKGSNADFDAARAAAEQKLIGTDPIECIIDVHRARLSGISPLPQRVYNENGWYINADKNEKSEISAPKAIDGAMDVTADMQENNATKILQWERKLLDLGLRNNLINLRLSKTLVPIISSSLEELEDALVSGSDFSVLPKPTDWRSPSDGIDFELMHDLGQYENVIKSEFANKRLRSVLTEGELSKTMKELYRTAKTSLEENGANTLYLALGLLRWYENARSTKPRYAPIVLIPVDIVRKAANQGYVIRLRDDDPQMNITILEKIKQDFDITVSGLDPLPTDEHGIDIRKVFTILRKTIMGQARWDVLESAYLGVFSFSQFVMWNDLRNRKDDLIKNKVVKSLTEGKLSWDAEPMNIGDRVSEDGVLLPMSADASQLYAIRSSCEGQSFVLHGPPGTGKSQTITSLIANALAQGKSVLFVAEKMAALEVVQKRLDNIGIGRFCLELHSNKSKKKDVLEQLRRAMEVTRNQTPAQYAQKAEQISKMRKELDCYSQQLHRTLKSGYTLFDLINEYEDYRNAENIPAFARSYVKELTKENLDEHTVVLERMTAAGRAIGHPHGHPLSAIGVTQYSQQIRAELPERIRTYRVALSDASEPVAAFSSSIGIGNISTFEELARLKNIADEFALWYTFPQSWARSHNLSKLLIDIEETADHFIKAQELYNNIRQTWTDAILLQNIEPLLNEYNSAMSKWVLPKTLGINKLLKKLTPYLSGKSKADLKPVLGKELMDLHSYQTELKTANNMLGGCSGDMGDLYRGSNTDWQEVKRLASQARQSNTVLKELTSDESVRINYCALPSLKGYIEYIINKYPALTQARERCRSMLQLADGDFTLNWINDQITVCDNILTGAEMIKEWITFNNTAQEAESLGLGAVVDAYKGGISHNNIIPAYKKSILSALIIITIDENNTLNSFSGPVFNEKIEQYKRIDKELVVLAQREIFCRLASKIPDFTGEAAHSSELGILQRMIKSNGRGTSIRKLFESIPGLLSRLCPCMLMSPISAAQYLDPKREPFDIVVFDEASQLPTCKAVGVLARGKNAVIVGDPKQMPPTSFFATNTVDEDNLDIEDLESILDDCLAIGMPQTHLLWHYRSRHESLIAFSNNQFYENKLYTFPSVNDRESKVSLVHVDGVFERGKSRKNQAEAEAVVSEIKRRCHDKELSKQSLGVVTFNISQQNVIDDLLNEACESDSQLEKWVYNTDEPVFIKNLENVQGDERDVILFSIGFGPDENGKVYMNFGPLNRDGGWRRLNVAVSRARCEMMVFSTLTADQINLSKTNSEGVAALKAFLSYASGKELTLDENASEQYKNIKEGIARAICKSLQDEGYSTDISVGHSEYRIDIGVIDPDDPQKYILGILLDGASYGTSKTTRDREIAQISVLNGLGWNILRVWTMDWWDNSQKEIKRIINKLHELQDAKSAVKPDEDKPEQPAQSIEDDTDKSSAQVILNSPQLKTQQDIKAKTVKKYNVTFLPKYSTQIENTIGQEAFVKRSVDDVIENEAPITQELLTRRLVPSLGFAHSGAKIQAYLSWVYDNMHLKTTIANGQTLYWSNLQNPDEYYQFRASGDDMHKRESKDVPLPEAVNAVCCALYKQIGLSQDDLIREAAKLMGYTRLGSIVTALFKSAIDAAQAQGKIEQSVNGNYKLTDAFLPIAERLDVNFE